MLWPGGGGGGGGAGALFMLLAPRLTTIKWRHGQFNNNPTIYPKHSVSKIKGIWNMINTLTQKTSKHWLQNEIYQVPN